MLNTENKPTIALVGATFVRLYRNAAGARNEERAFYAGAAVSANAGTEEGHALRVETAALREASLAMFRAGYRYGRRVLRNTIDFVEE